MQTRLINIDVDNDSNSNIAARTAIAITRCSLGNHGGSQAILAAFCTF
jgi:hypothetical protein